MSKKENKLKKDLFFKNHSIFLLEKGAKIYPHFVKLVVRDDHYDYYPGAEKLNKISPGQKNHWVDLSNDEFISIVSKMIC